MEVATGSAGTDNSSGLLLDMYLKVCNVLKIGCKGIGIVSILAKLRQQRLSTDSQRMEMGTHWLPFFVLELLRLCNFAVLQLRERLI